MSEKSWASLAPLLDHRRYVESIVAGIRIPAHASFRACITMNEDASTYEIPDYMLSRIQPAVEVTFPERDEEFQILKYHLPFAPDQVLELTVEFLQGAHRLGLPHSMRDGINIARFAVKQRHHPSRGTRRPKDGGGQASWRELFEQSVRQILGAGALDLKEQAPGTKAAGGLDLRELFTQLEQAMDDEDDPEQRQPPDPPRRPGPGKGPGKPRR